MPTLNIVLLSSLLINFSLDIMETDWDRVQSLLVSSIVSLTFILDETKWLLSNADKFAAWLKTFVIAYVTCEMTLLINLIYMLFNKYSVDSMSWYTPSLILAGLLLYRQYRKI